MTSLASGLFDDAPREVKEYISKGPDEFQRWVRSKLLGSRSRARSRDRARDTKIRELEEENTRLKKQAEEKAQQQAEKQAEEIRRQAEENQNLRAELEKLRQSKQKNTTGTSEQAEQRAENIKKQLAAQHAKEIENLRAELAKKIDELQAEKERLKQGAGKAKGLAELELRQENTAGTDAASGALASAASSTTSNEQADSSTSPASTSNSSLSESQSDTPPTKPPLEVDPGFGRKTSRGFLPINSPLGGACAASSSGPGLQLCSSPAQDAADVNMPDAADAAPPGSNHGAQSTSSSSLSSPPDSPFQNTADPPLNVNVNPVVDSETSNPQRSCSVLKKPEFSVPHKHRLFDPVRQHWVDCYNGEATSADTRTAIAEGPFAADPPPGSAGQHGDKAVVEGVPSNGSDKGRGKHP
ncbi:hypothetical protein, variant [Gaeumannomyces tritici R3-111a-1]|uniref:Uncharacterized protein n=1 Tax=Gaeumannomyces tritici (strain R3-111a-1) TaxID=644352 RepID=J3PJZ1_GAET3|nr:hypothetical protein, variant [Gaeumannomyces tritici R3-111a-1]EJT68598.1 hypothetical protein, variant [Gaeumannomyces tritici R3-111a-1]